MSEEPNAVSGDGGPQPPRSRRKALIVSIIAVVVAAVIALVVVVVTGSGAQPQKYTSLPAPCTMITAANLAKYLPDATSSPQSEPSSSTHQVGACTWSSITGREDRTLLAQVDVYSSATGITSAQHAYDTAVPPADCKCTGFKVATQSVAGLGDQAIALFTTISTGSAAAAGLAWNVPAITLVVRSANADISLAYDIGPIGSAPPPPANAVRLAGTIAMARDVLAALATPAAARSTAVASAAAAPSAASVPPSPHAPRYADPHQPCALIKASALASYGLDATGNSIPNPVKTPAGLPDAPQLSNCGWSAPGGNLLLNLSIYPDSTASQQGFEFDVQAARQNESGITFNGAQPVTSLGQQATAISQTIIGNLHAVDLYVWSGNAEIELDFTDGALGTPPSRATKLAADIAMARDVLAALPT